MQENFKDIFLMKMIKTLKHSLIAFYADDSLCYNLIFPKVEKLDKMVTELAGFQQYVSHDSI